MERLAKLPCLDNYNNIKSAGGLGNEHKENTCSYYDKYVTHK